MKLRIDIPSILNLLTSFALLIGLIFVLIELRQTRDIANAQLISDGWSHHSSTQLAFLGESQPQEILAKSCTSPETLTLDELQIIDIYFQQTFVPIRRLLSLGERTSVFDSDDWNNPSYSGTYYAVFASSIGRAWWNNATWLEPPIRALGDEYREKLASQKPYCEKQYDYLVSEAGDNEL